MKHLYNFCALLFLALPLTSQITYDTLQYDNCFKDSLKINGAILSLIGSNAVDLSGIGSPDQVIGFINDKTITLTNGGTADISAVNTDNQTLLLDGTLLSILNENTVDLESILPDSLVQAITLDNDTLFLSAGGGAVSLKPYGSQDLSIVDSTLNISGGQGVNLGGLIGFNSNRYNSEQLTKSGRNIILRFQFQ